MTAPRLVALRGDESDLFTAHHARLRRAVRSAVNTSPEVVDDACQAAWAILLRRQPDRGPTLSAWLKTVAIHEAYRLHRTDHAAVSLQGLGGGEEDADARTAAGCQHVSDDRLELQLEARRALRALAELPDRQRECLTLKAAGFSYDEIRELAGGVTLTNVNKHLVRARRRMRDVRAA